MENEPSDSALGFVDDVPKDVYLQSPTRDGVVRKGSDDHALDAS